MSKANPMDAETYVVATKNKASSVGKNIAELEKLKQNSLEDKLLEIQSLKAQQIIDDLKKGYSTPQTNVLGQIFNKSPEDIARMLENMSPQAMNNLIALSTAGNQPVPIQTPPPQTQQNDAVLTMLLKYVLESNKQPPPPPANSTKEMLEAMAMIIKIMNENNKPQQNSNGADIFKLLMEYNKPLLDQLKNKDKEIMDARIKEIEAKMPGTLEDQIKYIQDIAPVLGLGRGGGTSAYDIQLEEMRQNREIDLKRLDWEQAKYEMEQQSDMAKWEQIGKLFQGPLGDVLRNMGTAGAERVRGGKPSNRMPQPVKTNCPNCGQAIYVDSTSDIEICGHCGALLQQQQQRQQPEQPQPSPAHVEEQPSDTTHAEEEEEEETEEEEAEEIPEEPKPAQPAPAPPITLPKPKKEKKA